MLSRIIAPKPLLSFLLLLLWVPQLIAASYLNKRVVVHLKTGGTLTGVVLDEKPDGSIKLLLAGGQAEIKADRIASIVVQKPPEEEFAERAAKCKTPDDWVKLAKWCGLGDVRLPKERARCLEEALKLDPDHEGAHLELGDVKVGDKWYPEEEGMKLLGMEKVDGKWYPPQEAEKIRRLKKLKKDSRYVAGLVDQTKERWGVPWATAKVIETPHYKVKCNSTEEVAKRYADIMESLYRAYDQVFPTTEYPRFTSDKGVIYVFRNNAEFIDFTLMGQGIGGFFSHADAAVRAYHGSFGVTGSTDMVLAHEATHQFQSWIMKEMRTVPTWLIEGMAVYYGDGTNISRNRVELHQIPRDRLATLKEAIEGGHYTNVQALLRIPHAMFGGQFYNHAWGVIYWCLQGDKPEYRDFPGAHKGEGKRVWDQYLRHVCRESKSVSEVSNLMAHLDEEGKYFANLIVKETGYSSLEEWEEDYKKFILALPLEPLGEWKGLTWDGSKLVGIQMKFPKGLKPVPDKHLRYEFREAAASQTKEADVRMWIGVEFNWFRQEGAGEEVLKGVLGGFFRRDGDYVEEPKSFERHSIHITTAKFKGRLAKRREIAAGRTPGEQKGGSAGGGEEKKKEKKEKKEAEPAFKQLDPDAYVTVRVAIVTTVDKIYMIALAGEEAPFSKVEPYFDDCVESVKLTFK